MNLTKWLAHIKGLHAHFIDFSLERVMPVVHRLSLNEDKPWTIKIAGTNGKGTVATLLETAYRHAGYRTVCVTSPFFKTPRELLRINGDMLSEALWCEAFAHIEKTRAEVSLTPYEFYILAALWLAKGQGCDVWVLEMCMGGARDIVNVVEGDGAVLTNVSLEHTEYLGATRDLIAQEKSAIFRDVQWAVTGVRDMLSAVETALSFVPEVRRLGRDMTCVQETYYSQRNQVPLQSWRTDAAAAALALAALEVNQKALPVEVSACLPVLSSVQLPGRFECFEKGEVFCVFDVAHNPAASAHLFKKIKAMANGRSVYCLWGMQSSKDHAACLAPWVGQGVVWQVCQLPSSRSADAHALSSLLKAQGEMVSGLSETPQKGFDVLLSQITSPAILVIWGSFEMQAG